MSAFRPRQYDEDYPDSDVFVPEPPEPDPDVQRDVQLEREWDEGRAQDLLDDDPYDFGQAPEWVDEYMVRTYSYSYRSRGVHHPSPEYD